MMLRPLVASFVIFFLHPDFSFFSTGSSSSRPVRHQAPWLVCPSHHDSSRPSVIYLPMQSLNPLQLFLQGEASLNNDVSQIKQTLQEVWQEIQTLKAASGSSARSFPLPSPFSPIAL